MSQRISWDLSWKNEEHWLFIQQNKLLQWGKYEHKLKDKWVGKYLTTKWIPTPRKTEEKSKSTNTRNPMNLNDCIQINGEEGFELKEIKLPNDKIKNYQSCLKISNSSMLPQGTTNYIFIYWQMKFLGTPR